MSSTRQNQDTTTPNLLLLRLRISSFTFEITFDSGKIQQVACAGVRNSV